MSIASDAVDKIAAYGFGTRNPGDTAVYVFANSNRNLNVTKLPSIGTAPSPRRRPILAVAGRDLIIYGGFDLNTGKVVNDST